MNPVKAADGNPNQGWETASEYLSGPVRKKLKAAEVYAKANPIYLVNVEALKADTARGSDGNGDHREVGEPLGLPRRITKHLSMKR